MASLTTTLGDYTFQNVFMNASGVHCQTEAELDQLAASPAGTLVTKTGTLEARKGNPEPRFAQLALGTINSMGLPNLGIDYYIAYAERFQEKHPGRPIFLSVAGMKPDDFPLLAQKIQDSGFTGLTEFNLSCPNVPGKPQIAYDFAATETILAAIFKVFKKPAGVKLPPYFDLAQFDQVAAILNRYPLTFINSINSLGNGLWIDPATDTAAIKPKGGFGGIGGQYAKPIALANVRAFRQRLRGDISIIGTGGVTTGRDAYELILCGANLVSLGSILATEGLGAFTRLASELEAEMAKKGYTSLPEFRGQLKTL
ncbi:MULTISPECIES: dihydroorotate oxidase [unclassified Lacticaseibacillus]|uniref:dihydroorotate oxidase n=1 Tax=unclassified Lacticaseibacillus TaxID=2759744 RepID=UPI00194440F8|nr:MULTISPECIES: dihydroorotate oxidase [unclassified Lacticaseibacillus]